MKKLKIAFVLVVLLALALLSGGHSHKLRAGDGGPLPLCQPDQCGRPNCAACKL